MSKKEKILHYTVLALIALQPVFDLDYLIYDALDSVGLPRPSTVVRFILIPLAVLLTFFFREKSKKKTFISATIYGVLLIAYFFLHNKQCAALVERLWLTDNFVYNTWRELTYVLTLVVPYGLVYSAYHEHFTREELKKITVFTSVIISFPILFGDLYVCAKSTYYGNTVGNIFSWFSGIYDWYHPRTLASKFYFNEGNTIGMLLFMVLPLLYYFFAISESKKERKYLAVIILVQSFAMQMLATRVATYGAVIMPIVFLVLYLFDALIMKHRKVQKPTILLTILCAAIFGAILNWTPAVQNQRVDAKNDVALLSNGAAQFGEEELKNAEDLVPGSEEWVNFYVYMFEAYGINARYIQSVPSMYYTEYYSYQHDPKFWVDVCFMPVFDRVSGRQIETIFFNYKYENLTQAEKILGMGYSTFNSGSIVLEKDFVQQIYTLGYAGEVLCIFPWIGLLLYGAFHFLKYFKKLMNLENLCLVVSLGCAFGGAWLSGHMLDQFLTTSFTALVVAILLNKVHEAKICDR